MLEDKLLVLKLKRGDADALRRIYEKYKDDLLTITASLLHEAGAAEDVLHNVFVSFAKDISRFQLLGNLRSHLITRVVNQVREKFRRKMYQVVEVDRTGLSGSNSEGADRAAAVGEESQLLTDALARLPIQQREVIILYLQGGMKFREIANIQDVSINTVWSRYRYGLDELRSFLIGEIIE